MDAYCGKADVGPFFRFNLLNMPNNHRIESKKWGNYSQRTKSGQCAQLLEFYSRWASSYKMGAKPLSLVTAAIFGQLPRIVLFRKKEFPDFPVFKLIFIFTDEPDFTYHLFWFCKRRIVIFDLSLNHVHKAP